MQKYDQALYYEIFQKWEYAFLDCLFKSAKTLVDIGGHKGFFSLYAFQKSFHWDIYFFEPIEENFYEAQKNLKIFQENIHFFNKAISYKKWEVFMYYNKEKTMQSSFFETSFLWRKWEVRKVSLFNINDLQNEEKLKKSIDILKIDIEWYEFELLDTMGLKFFENVWILVLEYHEIKKEYKKEWIKTLLNPYFSKIEDYPSPYKKELGILFAKK